MTTYYHWTSDTLRDGRAIPPIGEWLEHEGPLVPCDKGLHASQHPFDALRWAPGNLLHKVELDGEIIPHGNPVDKVCARRRRITATIDAKPVLRAFARRVALDVLPMWKDVPDVVRRYLETGDESIREAAWEAALDAAAEEKYRGWFAEMVEADFKAQEVANG